MSWPGQSSATEQCHSTVLQNSATEQCHRTMPQNSATEQCHSTMLQNSATEQCHSTVLQNSATAQCYRTVPQNSATAQCYRTVPQNSAIAQCYDNSTGYWFVLTSCWRLHINTGWAECWIRGLLSVQLLVIIDKKTEVFLLRNWTFCIIRALRSAVHKQKG
jgi:hypothetical protein